MDMVGELNRRLEEQRREEVQRKSNIEQIRTEYRTDQAEAEAAISKLRKLDEMGKICLTIERKR